jgi:hypothetical protein
MTCVCTKCVIVGTDLDWQSEDSKKKNDRGHSYMTLLHVRHTSRSVENNTCVYVCAEGWTSPTEQTRFTVGKKPSILERHGGCSRNTTTI